MKLKLIKSKKLIFYGIIIFLSFIFYLTQQSSYISFSYFNHIKDHLLLQVQKHYLIAPPFFMTVYIIMTLISPSAALLSMVGGFLFGVINATIFIILAGTTSACIAFIATRHFIGNYIQIKYAEHLKRFNKELEIYGMYYLIIIRIIPLLPFLLVNITAGLTKIPLTTFCWSTALGIIPATLAYTFAGKELSLVRSPQEIITIKLFLILCALACLALLPVLLKKYILQKDS